MRTRCTALVFILFALLACAGAAAQDAEVAWNARFARNVKAAEQQDFITGMNRGNADHAEAAMDLLNFAQAMSQQATPHA